MDYTYYCPKCGNVCAADTNKEDNVGECAVPECHGRVYYTGYNVPEWEKQDAIIKQAVKERINRRANQIHTVQNNKKRVNGSSSSNYTKTNDIQTDRWIDTLEVIAWFVAIAIVIITVIMVIQIKPQFSGLILFGAIIFAIVLVVVTMVFTGMAKDIRYIRNNKQQNNS